jgi:hypothetical protein
MKKIIFFELNEVPKRILDEYVKKYPKSYINSFLKNSSFHETIASDKGHLSPWITWPTVHRGVSNEYHKIHDYGQDLTDQNKKFPPIWSHLKRKKISVGVFGSLHSNFMPSDFEEYSFYVPDVFSPHYKCYPKEIINFQKFQLNMIRKSNRNVSKSIMIRETIMFLKDIFKIGITLGTLKNIIIQLFNETINSSRTVRRRTIHSIISFDVFFKLLKEKKPDFCTLFTNHVASSMHRYWEALFPKDFYELNKPKEWYHQYKDEIFFSMKATDRMLNKLCKFVKQNSEYQLWVLSSMGQVPNESKNIKSQILLTNEEKFFSNFQLIKDDFQLKPSMAPIYVFEIKNKKKIDNLKKIKKLL